MPTLFWPMPSVLALSVLSISLFASCSDTTQSSNGDTGPFQYSTIDFSGTNVPEACQNDIFGAGYASTTFSGGTSIDGDKVLCGNGFYVNPEYIWLSFYESLDGNRDISLKLIVPASQYNGPGSYNCGHTANTFPESDSYCSITVRSCTNDTSGQSCIFWMLSLDDDEGLHPNCSITISTSPYSIFRGSFSCADIKNEATVFHLDHADRDKTLDISGTWETTRVLSEGGL